MPNAHSFTDPLLGIFRAGDLPPELAARGAWLLALLIDGFAIEDDRSMRAVSHWDLPPKELATARDYLSSLPSDRFPNMSSIAAEMGSGKPDEAFDVLIDVFIDGLAARASNG
jgi:hypothetical protein